MTEPMDQPATKREIALLLERIEALGERIDTTSERIDTTSATLRERIDTTTARIDATSERIVNELSADLARHARTIGEDMRRSIGLVDDRYNDLPARVTRLETAVFKPAPLKRQRRR